MLAKLTGKNQLTLPKAVMQQFDKPDYFDVASSDGKIILTPVKLNAADAVRDKLEELSITEKDIADAIAVARSSANQ